MAPFLEADERRFTSRSRFELILPLACFEYIKTREEFQHAPEQLLQDADMTHRPLGHTLAPSSAYRITDDD